jgi:rhamnosyltransferase
MTVPETSIIILTKNGGANFPRLLECIYCQQYNGIFEVIVIDSGSGDGTLEEAGKYPLKLIQIKPHEFHHSKTRNLGAELAQGKYLAYITQDALPLENSWLEKLTGDFSDPQVAMVVGRQIPRESAKPPEKFFYYYNFPDFRLVVKSGVADYYHDNVFISDVNAAYRREILLKYRFKEDIVMAEDKEIAIRFINAGHSIIYEPSAAVYHSHYHGLTDLFAKHLDFGLAIKQGVSRLPKTSNNSVAGIAGYIGAEYRFLTANHHGKWLPYALIYETTKYAGLLLGISGLVRGPSAGRVKQDNA